MFQPLDPLLHAELRLAVMSLLISADEAEFPYIKEQTGATAGNLSVQVDKLSTAGYIEVEKTFKGKRQDLQGQTSLYDMSYYRQRKAGF